jgi:hypothetical protein
MEKVSLTPIDTVLASMRTRRRGAWASSDRPNKALQPTPLGVGSSDDAPCGAAELGRWAARNHEAATVVRRRTHDAIRAVSVQHEV